MSAGDPKFMLGQITIAPADGWRCPVCGRGNAPWLASCPCAPVKLTVTSGTGAACRCGVYVRPGDSHICDATLTGM